MSLIPLETRGALLGSDESAQPARVVRLYGDGDSTMNSLAEFLGGSLCAGDSAVVIATRAHAIGIANRLETRGRLEFVRAVEEGRYRVFDAGELLAGLVKGGLPDQDHFADAVGKLIESARDAALSTERGVVVFGEMVAILWARGQREAAIRLEELWNDLGRAHAFSLRCAYPFDGFSGRADANDFARLGNLRPQAVPAETFSTLLTDEERTRIVALLQQHERALQSEAQSREELRRKIEGPWRAEWTQESLSVFGRLQRGAQDEQLRHRSSRRYCPESRPLSN